MENKENSGNYQLMGFTITQWLIVIFYGTLVGLNESYIGVMSIPYRSVIVNVISILLLSLALYQFPKAGTSFLIISIAILYKLNNLGFHSCTANVFLCGPLALVYLGLSFELFSLATSYFVSPKSKIYLPVTAAASAFISFTLFGITNTFVLNAWDISKLMEFIFLKGFLTAFASSVFVIVSFYIQQSIKPLEENIKVAKTNYGVAFRSISIIALWILGSIVNL